jgi:hypothetical protein
VADANIDIAEVIAKQAKPRTRFFWGFSDEKTY